MPPRHTDQSPPAELPELVSEPAGGPLPPVPDTAYGPDAVDVPPVELSTPDTAPAATEPTAAEPAAAPVGVLADIDVTGWELADLQRVAAERGLDDSGDVSKLTARITADVSSCAGL